MGKGRGRWWFVGLTIWLDHSAKRPCLCSQMIAIQLGSNRMGYTLRWVATESENMVRVNRSEKRQQRQLDRVESVEVTKVNILFSAAVSARRTERFVNTIVDFDKLVVKLRGEKR